MVKLLAKHWNELKGGGTPGGHAHYKPTGQEDVGSGKEIEPAGILYFLYFYFLHLTLNTEHIDYRG